MQTMDAQLSCTCETSAENGVRRCTARRWWTFVSCHGHIRESSARIASYIRKSCKKCVLGLAWINDAASNHCHCRRAIFLLFVQQPHHRGISKGYRSQWPPPPLFFFFLFFFLTNFAGCASFWPTLNIKFFIYLFFFHFIYFVVFLCVSYTYGKRWS